MTSIYFFDAPEAKRVHVAGGKGMQLARMTQRGFPVPPGFVVGSAAYAALVESVPGMARALEATRGASDAQLPVRCEAVKALLLSAPMPEAVAQELAAAVARLGAGPFAVRSSSTLEDLAAAAFAGQHETFLNVPPAGVADQVRACFASLWTERAARYRRRMGYALDGAHMAVVVQVLVDAAVAGVAFTVDPVAGDLGTLVVDASFGLGESVVSGEVTADHFRLARKDLSVVERRLGAKESRVVARPGGGVETVAAADGAKSSLSDPELRRIAELALAVEEACEFPQDIEWALDANGRAFLLQSRPVTTVPPRWTRDESAERFPNAMTPLGWEFAEAGFHDSLRHSLALMGMPPFPGKWFALFDGYVYGNDNAVRLFFSGRRAPFRDLAELRRLLPRVREQYAFVLELPAAWTRDLDRYLLGIGRLEGLPAPSSPLAHWERLLAIEQLGREYFRPNIAISLTHGLLHKSLFSALSLLETPSGAKQLYDQLTRFCETKTSLINKEMHALAGLLRADATTQERLSRGARVAIEGGLLDQTTPFATRLGRFLSDHAHRETDADPYQPTWGDAPWVPLEQLRLLASRPAGVDPLQRELDAKSEQHAAEGRLSAKAPEDLRFFLSELVRLARVYSALDDVEHYHSTRLHRLFRCALLDFGRHLRAQGLCAADDDLFFAERDALEKAVAAGPPAWKALLPRVASARAAYEAQRRQTPPWTLGEAEPPPASDSALSGIPGSPGTAEGPVFVVRSVDQFPDFPAGAVLVARTTNPSWTPLFYTAAAVVTESGGPLSHGAVTARELGLPAVMAVKGCMLLENGTRVRVDGHHGRVERLT